MSCLLFCECPLCIDPNNPCPCFMPTVVVAPAKECPFGADICLMDCQCDLEIESEDNVTKQADMVNHPPHYKAGPFECLEVIEALDLGYHLGNALKYLWRAGRKDDRLQDLLKAKFYVERAIKLETERK